MPRYGIGFNSQGHWTAYPGVVVTVDPSELDLANQGPTGVVALLGTATGFFPPKEYSRFPFDAATPEQYFTAGSDLLVTTKFATRPFNQLGFGPAEVYVVPINPATPATADLRSAAGSGPVTPTELVLRDTAGTVDLIRLKSPKPADNKQSAGVSVASNVITVKPPTGEAGPPPDETYDVTALGGIAQTVAAINTNSDWVTAEEMAATPTSLANLPLTAFPPPPAAAAAVVLTTLGWGAKFNELTMTVVGTVAPQTVKLQLPATTEDIVETYTFTPGDGGTQALVDDINSRSAIVKATYNSDVGTLIETGITPFAGGEDGVATINDWIEGIAALSTLRVNAIHVCTGDDEVWDALAAYCIDHRARGFVGSDTVRNWNGLSNRTAALTALKAEAGGINAPRIMHCGLGMNGYAGKYASARYAALAASLEPSVPMTFKFLDVDSVEVRLSKEEVGGVDGLLIYGVSPPMPDAANAFTYRVSRGLSTWTGDDNLYRREHSVLAAVDGIASQMDDAMQVYIGGEGNQGTLGRIRESVRRILEDATRPTAAIRINGYDPNIVVSFTSETVVRVTARVTPIPPINWINVNLILQRTEIEVSTEVNLAA